MVTIGRYSRCVLAVLVMAFCARAVRAENIISRPVGFVRIPVADNGRVLVSLPFLPFDPRLDSVLAGQLTGSANPASADRILKWDPTQPAYVQAVKADGTGNADVDGKWVTDLETGNASPLTLMPGEGFWIENRQQTTQSVYLAGDVVLDGTQDVVLPTSLSLVAYPYSTAMALDKTALAGQMAGHDGSDELIDPSSRPQAFVPGRGYWYNRKEAASLVWTEVRPYPDLFPSDDSPPLIADFKVGDRGRSVIVEVLCQGVSAEVIDIFYQDGSPTNCFDTRGPWLLAATIPTKGNSTIEWTDRGDAHRAPVDQVFGRYYLAGRADIDTDGNGIPDARERFLAGFQGRSAGGLSGTTGTDSPGSKPAAGTRDLQLEGAGRLSRAPIRMTARVIYVDRKTGHDGLTGRAPVVVGSDGPKKTIRSGLSAVENGGTVVIQQGSYGENLNISGKNVSIAIEGCVDISGCPSPSPEPPTGAFTEE